MNEWNLNSPLLSEMKVLECLSERSGISTYLVTHTPTGNEYIFKNVSIPASQTQVEGLRYSGAIQTAGEAQAYYEKVVADYKAELEALISLSESGCVAPYRVFHIQPKEEEVGFDIHLLAERRQSLSDYMDTVSMTHLKAANLALDLCNALTVLRQNGYIHCNIKPENIFLNNQGHFMIGDTGLFRADELKYAAVPDRMLNKFAAPELFDAMQSPNTTVDIYAIGLILYSIFNGNHSPFEDEKTSVKGASEMRLSGTALPTPIYADYEMASILLKACAFSPEERYQTPEELKQALMDYAQRNEPQDIIIVPPIIADEDTKISEEAMNEDIEPVQFASADELGEEFKHHFSPDSEGLNEIIEAIHEEISEEEAPSAETQDETAQEKAVPENTQEEAVPENTQEETEAQTEATEETAADEEAPAATEEIKPENKAKKKAPFWIWILVALAVLAGAAAAAYFVFIPNVEGITEEVIRSDSVTLALDVKQGAETIVAAAVDTYGNTAEATVQEGKLVFEGLNPGTQYTVRLSTVYGLSVRGENSTLITTAAATEILSFGAKPISEDQVELYFTIAGQDQESWKVRYGTSELDMVEMMFSGHSAIVSSLKPNSKYTFTLVGTNELTLTGDIQFTYDTTLRVSVTEILAKTTDDGVSLSWSFEGEAPAAWTVICRGADGLMKEETVSEPAISFTDLQKEKVYTVEIFCDGMPVAAEKIIRTADATISGIETHTADDGTLVLSWATEDDVSDGWMILCSLVDDPAVVQILHSNETTVSLAALLPECNYDIEVQTGSGMAVNGEAKLQVTTPKAAKFSGNGLTSTYVGLFVEPEAETWTYRDLASPKTSFAASENIAFAMEAMSGIKNSDDNVDITVSVRSADDKIVGLKSYSAVWDDMWDNKLFVGTPNSTPQETGKYTLEIFFNGYAAGSATFSVN